MAPRPGLSGDFEGDMEQIAAMRPAWVISLATPAELAEAGLMELGTAFQNRGSRWLHLPIDDYGIPDAAAEKIWIEHAPHFKAILDGHGRIVVHCRGGCGRSGMIALRLMVEKGETPPEAFRRLRGLHPDAVETEAQYEWAARGWKPPTFQRHEQ